jgi:polysaccharide export outer membrane protein
MIRFAMSLLAALSLTACSTLPSAAPTVGQVVRTQQGEAVEVRDITPALAATANPTPPKNSSWALRDAPALWDSISVGDTVGISIFEMGYGLFTPEESVAEAAASVAPRAGGRALPPIIIPESGMIDLPYIGSIKAEGMTPAGLTKEIERRLKGKSQFAQAMVTLERGVARSVILSGDVKQPGRLLLTASEERLLDAVALAGGPQGRTPDTIVRLTRGGFTEAVRMDLLAPDSSANVRLAPGDRIELVRNARTFTVLGAAKTVSEIAFDSDRLTLIEALSRAGGPTDEKADATGVFIFRYEERADGSGEQPVIYRLNLLQPQSYFAAQRFAMREKDVLLIANARSNQLGKFVQLLNGLTAPAVLLDVITR